MGIFKKIDRGLITLALVTTLSVSLGGNYHQYEQNRKLSKDINIKAESIKVLETNIEGQKNTIKDLEQTLEDAEQTIEEQNTLLLEKDESIKKLKKAEENTSAKSLSRAVRSTGQRLNVTAKERELMARLVEAEGGIEPYRGKVAIANVIINRVLDSRYPNTVNGVIYQKHQYESVSRGMLWDRPTGDDCYRAVDDALNGVNVVPTDTISFWADYLDPSNSLWKLPITARIGGHVFTNKY